MDGLIASVTDSRMKVIRHMEIIQYKNKNLQAILKQIHEAKDVTKNNQCELIGILFLLCTHFNEDIAQLYHNVSFCAFLYWLLMMFTVQALQVYVDRGASAFGV